jgi:hypothetical protein
MVHYLNEDPDIRWQSWDAVVSLGWCDVPDNHLRVLQVGGDPIGRTGNLGSYETALVRMEHVGDELEIPDGSPADLRDLVKRELLPLVNPREHRLRIAPWRLAGRPGSDPGVQAMGRGTARGVSLRARMDVEPNMDDPWRVECRSRRR